MLLTLPIPGLDLPEWMNMPPPVSRSPFEELILILTLLPLLPVNSPCMPPTTLLKLHLVFVWHAFSSQLVVITGGAEHDGNSPFCRGPVLMVHDLHFLQPGARVLPL
jgi:hypothetical protein